MRKDPQPPGGKLPRFSFELGNKIYYGMSDDSGMIMCKVPLATQLANAKSAVLKLLGFSDVLSGIGRTCRRPISFAGHAIDAHPLLRRCCVNSIEGRPIRDIPCYGKSFRLYAQMGETPRADLHAERKNASTHARTRKKHFEMRVGWEAMLHIATIPLQLSDCVIYWDSTSCASSLSGSPTSSTSRLFTM